MCMLAVGFCRFVPFPCEPSIGHRLSSGTVNSDCTLLLLLLANSEDHRNPNRMTSLRVNKDAVQINVLGVELCIAYISWHCTRLILDVKSEVG